TPDAFGIYRTAYAKVEGDFEGVHSYLTFDAEAFDASRLAAHADATTTEVEEPLAVFVSNTNRPREVTFEQFSLPLGTGVLLLAPARLAEAEGLRGYDFVAGTDAGIWVVENAEGYPLSEVTTAFGVAVSSLTSRAMYAPVPG